MAPAGVTVGGVTAETDGLAEYFRRERASFTTSPLYRSLCDAVAGDQPVLALLTQRQPGQQAAFLLFGAVHYLLLQGAPHPLRGYYPSLAGPAAGAAEDAGPVFIDFCRAHEDELAALIRTRLVQTNVVRRVTGLRLALAAVRRRCGQPVHLIDVGASAGVLLHVDRYRYVLGGQVFGSAGTWSGPMRSVLARGGEPGLVGEHDGLHPVPQAEFAEDPGHVGLDGRLAEGQLRREFGVAQAAGQQPQHLEFPRGQLGQVAVPGGRGGRAGRWPCTGPGTPRRCRWPGSAGTWSGPMRSVLARGGEPGLVGEHDGLHPVP